MHFHVHYSIIYKIQKQPKCSLTDEGIKKMWCIYNEILLSTTQKDEVLPFVTTWLDLEGIMLHKISQAKKGKNYMTSLICRV